MYTVVDVQGFKTADKTFTPKELAVFDGTHISHYIFKPPYPFALLPKEFQKQGRWLMDHHHCLYWDDGFTPVHQFKNILQRLTQNSDTIYVKGKEKAQYIQKYTNKPVIELEESPALSPTVHQCFYHSKPQCICAMANVQNLYSNYLMH